MMAFVSKQDYQNNLFDLLNAVLPHYTDGDSRLVLGYTGAGYSENIANIEAFARVLWGLAPYLSGGGSNEQLENIYLRGITKGTDPKAPEYWGTPDDYSQLFVEMAAISLGMILAPQKLWDPLSPEAKSNLTAWLGTINDHALWLTNWAFFGVLVNVALLKVGSDRFNQQALDKCLSNINSLYVGDGWYTDAYPYSQFDYYNAFAFHFYGLLYATFMQERDPVQSQQFKERANIFGQQFVYWFDKTGAAVPYGRSLTYRFAEAAFFSACIYAGIEPLPLATMKGIIERHLEYWWQSHMRDFSGILTIGYRYPNLIMAENYNAPGSPLWALKTFLVLGLPDNHPYWSTKAVDFPAFDEIKTLDRAKMIMVNSGDTATLLPAGLYDEPYPLGHYEEKYAKFAYSSKYGFSVRKENVSLALMAPDSDLVFKVGDIFVGRKAPSKVQISNGTITTQWSPFPGIDVTTVITPTLHGHSRRHTIVSWQNCVAYDCGFSHPLEYKNYAAETDNVTAQVRSDLGSCTVYLHDLDGNIEQTEGVIIQAAPNTNLLFPRTSIPAVKFSVREGITNVLTSIITD